MNDNGFGNEEFEGSGNGDGRKCSPKQEFWMFFLIFGWEGPFGVIYGLIKSDLGFLIGGLLIGSFFWGFFGINIFKDMIKKK